MKKANVMPKTSNTLPKRRAFLAAGPAGPAEPTKDQKQRRLVLKHDNHFLLLDLTGGMKPKHGAGLGLYFNDTRYLSTWHWCLNGAALQFLNGNADEGFASLLNYSNQPSTELRDQEVYVQRRLLIDEGMVEELKLVNFSAKRRAFHLSLRYGSDFADMFEVRGAVRKNRGDCTRPIIEKLSDGSYRISFGYLGLDGYLRRTAVTFRGPGIKLTAARACFQFELESGSAALITATVETSEEKTASATITSGQQKPLVRTGTCFDTSLSSARERYAQWLSSLTRITTGSKPFNKVIDQAYRDIYLLLQHTEGGRIPAAGLPWFAVAFGRDSLVLGLQTLPLMPSLTRDILTTLAYYQGDHYEVETACAPGRIMHELRPGEMARLDEIAFRPYYGTVDATPLWLWLLAEYVQQTSDFGLVRKLWKNVKAALDYLDKEVQATGFLTYGGRGDTALSNQGWKDSGNCIVHKDGSLARAPIAVCEAQGYLYAAWSKLGRVANNMGYKSLGRRLTLQAIDLKKRFNRRFYVPGENYYAIALDGNGKRCEAVSSNPGHLIVTGILPLDRARAVAQRLVEPDMFSGFGIRTLSSKEKAYQPMDYQVGSVWPHDNGFAVAGMTKLGLAHSAHKVLGALNDVAESQSDKRLPELFCGFDRGEAVAPVPYPVACVPQLWAAGSVLHMLCALIKMGQSAGQSQSTYRDVAPAWLGSIETIAPGN